MTFKKNPLLVFFLCACFSCSAQVKFEKTDIFIKTENEPEQTKKITVELAISSQQQTTGFMGRKTIPEGSGMIFLYKTDLKLRFWMKNTPHPLSIAFIDSSGTIKEILDLTPYSLESVSSTNSVRYALEVPKGMFSRMGIKEGDKLSKETIFFLKRKAVGY